MKTKFDSIIDIVHEEYCRACKKHPVFPKDLIHKINIITEEAGEAAKAANEYYWKEKPDASIQEVIKEIVQTASTCIRTLMELKK